MSIIEDKYSRYNPAIHNPIYYFDAEPSKEEEEMNLHPLSPEDMISSVNTDSMQKTVNVNFERRAVLVEDEQKMSCFSKICNCVVAPFKAIANCFKAIFNYICGKKPLEARANTASEEAIAQVVQTDGELCLAEQAQREGLIVQQPQSQASSYNTSELETLSNQEYSEFFGQFQQIEPETVPVALPNYTKNDIID